MNRFQAGLRFRLSRFDSAHRGRSQYVELTGGGHYSEALPMPRPDGAWGVVSKRWYSGVAATLRYVLAI